MRPETTSYDRGRKRTCTFVPAEWRLSLRFSK